MLKRRSKQQFQDLRGFHMCAIQYDHSMLMGTILFLASRG